MEICHANLVTPSDEIMAHPNFIHLRPAINVAVLKMKDDCEFVSQECIARPYISAPACDHFVRGSIVVGRYIKNA